MYHLTDTPSVLTQLVGKKRSLCVFDPNLRYVPDANTSTPGMRYDVAEIQDKFPDIFSCYLPKCFNIDDSTLFRFPLHTPEMAEKSDISKRTVDPEKLLDLLDELKQEACESLLFTNNITKISISKVDHHTGKLVNNYEAVAQLSKEHKEWKSELAEVRRTAAQIEGDDRLRNVPLRKVMSTLVINDTKGVSEKWCVSEQLGIEPSVQLPKSVAHASRSGELRLHHKVALHVCEKVEETRRKRSVFCFLPLPVETTLPVHVNGHLALGYENRRTLWDKADRDSYKTEWNEFLCREVIAPCHVRLLTAVRAEFLKAYVDENERVLSSLPRREIHDAIAADQSQLPTFDEKQPDWDILVQAVYERCAATDAPVFPSARLLEDNSESSTCCITWLPATGSGDQKAFFAEPNLSLHVKQALVLSGMKLITAQPVLIESLKQTHLPVEILSPESLMSFFAAHSEGSSSCELGELPIPIGKSLFKTADTLHSVLEYCSQDPQFVSRLDGTPLLLTADDMLRVFDSNNPVYHTESAHLAPHSKDRFLHSSMRKPTILGGTMLSRVFTDVYPAASVHYRTRKDSDPNHISTDVFSSFTIKALASLLDKEFPLLQNNNGVVKWSCQDNTQPWLGRFWDFIHSQVVGGNGQCPEKRPSIEVSLSPLNQWCLIPALNSEASFLVSIEMASSYVIDLHSVKDEYLDKAFRKMNLLELDLASMTTFAGVNIGSLVRELVATVDMPHRILSVVHTHNKRDTALNKQERHRLLTFFCDNLQDFQRTGSNYDSRLQDLFFYTTVGGDVIALRGSRAYVLPRGIPNDGMDAWSKTSGIVFLCQDTKLTTLYKAIDCASLTHGDVYCNFIFKHRVPVD